VRCVQGYKYAAVKTAKRNYNYTEYKEQVKDKTKTTSLCTCGNSYGKHGKSDNCNQPCNVDSTKICGGFLANTVVSIEGR